MKISAETKGIFLIFCGLVVFFQKKKLCAPWVPVRHFKWFAQGQQLCCQRLLNTCSVTHWRRMAIVLQQAGGEK